MFSQDTGLLLLNKHQGEVQASIKTACQAQAQGKIFVWSSRTEALFLLRKEYFCIFMGCLTGIAAIEGHFS